MSHEARYQMAIVRELDWEKANNLNKTVIYEMGDVMMYRLMNALGISHVNNIDDFRDIYLTNQEFYYPPPVFSVHFDRESDISLSGSVEKCGIIENLKRLGVSDQYEYGCSAIRSRWYKVLGLEIKEELLKCLKDGDDLCKIKLIVKGWNKDFKKN